MDTHRILSIHGNILIYGWILMDGDDLIRAYHTVHMIIRSLLRSWSTTPLAQPFGKGCKRVQYYANIHVSQISQRYPLQLTQLCSFGSCHTDFGHVGRSNQCLTKSFQMHLLVATSRVEQISAAWHRTWHVAGIGPWEKPNLRKCSWVGHHGNRRIFGHQDHGWQAKVQLVAIELLSGWVKTMTFVRPPGRQNGFAFDLVQGALGFQFCCSSKHRAVGWSADKPRGLLLLAWEFCARFHEQWAGDELSGRVGRHFAIFCMGMRGFFVAQNQHPALQDVEKLQAGKCWKLSHPQTWKILEIQMALDLKMGYIPPIK